MAPAIASAAQPDHGNGRAAHPPGGDGFLDGPASQEQFTFSSDEIAQRAYQIYERDGRSDGKDMDHWLQAERELREERERAQARPAEAQQPRAASASRPQRADEAPRSARRHQPSMV